LYEAQLNIHFFITVNWLRILWRCEAVRNYSPYRLVATLPSSPMWAAIPLSTISFQTISKATVRVFADRRCQANYLGFSMNLGGGIFGCVVTGSLGTRQSKALLQSFWKSASVMVGRTLLRALLTSSIGSAIWRSIMLSRNIFADVGDENPIFVTFVHQGTKKESSRLQTAARGIARAGKRIELLLDLVDLVMQHGRPMAVTPLPLSTILHRGRIAARHSQRATGWPFTNLSASFGGFRRVWSLAWGQVRRGDVGLSR
jgi:hypothetical protein